MSLGHKISVLYQKTVSAITPTLKESKFYAEGKWTPEEYIQAGDFLTQKCPTWKWCCAAKGCTNSALPKDKQYLKTTVPCSKRALDYFNSNQTREKEVEGDWIEADLASTNIKDGKKEEKECLDLDAEEPKSHEKKIIVGNNHGDDGWDIEGLEINKITSSDKVEEKKSEFAEGFIDWENDEDSNVWKTRTYDVTVTYDFYYCVPRMWLLGYSENGVPLTDLEMKQDVMMEYRDKTVTIEAQPCTGIRNISVHPCRHSLLLKKMIENFEHSGKKLEIYMSILIFLKFLHSVVPTIQYDFTMDINF